MKDTITSALAKYRAQFASFTPGQKVVAIVGTGALLLGGYMVFTWASAPSYTPLYSNLSAADASAITQELDSTGVSYQLADGGNTVMVPQDAVYQARLDVASKGLPSSSGGTNTDPFKNSGIASSDTEQQSSIRLALEGDLATTIEHINGINNAVVHLAMPAKQVFADQQDPTTASVLVQTSPGVSLTSGQVQTITQLVSSSVDGLDPTNVSVADSTGRLYTGAGTDGTDSTMQDQQVSAVQADYQSRLQAMLDRVVGVGNSTVEVTPVLDFSKTTTDSTTYAKDKDNPIASESSTDETYDGTGANTAAGGVVGPDGQMDTTTTNGTGTGSKYIKKSATQDKAVSSVVQHIESTPGAVKNINVAVALDSATTKNFSATDIRNLVGNAVGIDTTRGDKITVISAPFDRTAETTAASELQAAEAAKGTAARNDMIRKGGIAGIVLLMLLLAALKGRKRNKQRQQATTLVVEQLKESNAARQAELEANNALAIEAPARTEEDTMRLELNALIERQPEDVAALLRGWLTERN